MAKVMAFQVSEFIQYDGMNDQELVDLMNLYLGVGGPNIANSANVTMSSVDIEVRDGMGNLVATPQTVNATDWFGANSGVVPAADFNKLYATVPVFI